MYKTLFLYIVLDLAANNSYNLNIMKLNYQALTLITLLSLSYLFLSQYKKIKNTIQSLENKAITTIVNKNSSQPPIVVPSSELGYAYLRETKQMYYCVNYLEVTTNKPSKK